MLLFYKCLKASQIADSLLVNVSAIKNFNPVLIPCRLFFKVNFGKPKEVKTSSEPKYKSLTGVNDPNFSHNLLKGMFDLNFQKTGVKNFLGECKKFYEESAEAIRNNTKFRVDDRKNKVEILYKFETPEDIDKFVINTDSSFNEGYSSASLKITEKETGLFSGYLNTDVPKTGNIRMAGWANFTCPKQYKSFYRVKSFEWSFYTHLVFKIRGDGRTYLVLLHTDYYFEEHCYLFAHQLFTRGGPYWEVVEVPFAHFFLNLEGRIHRNQKEGLGKYLDHVTALGITSGGFEGPFKLEIDYIGLVFKPFQKMHCPFEHYRDVK